MANTTVKDFYNSLTGASKDIFASVVNEMQSSAPEDKIERLTVFLNQLKLEIDAINKRRQAIGSQLNNIETLLKDLERYQETNNGLELQLFHGSLISLINQFKGEISSLKPENKLQKKFDVARKREALLQRQKLAVHLAGGVLDRKLFVTKNIKSDSKAPERTDPFFSVGDNEDEE